MNPHTLDNQRIYAARFNGRLLAAVRVTLNNKKGMLDSLCVRDVTRRRGVGRYLLEEMISDNPQVQIWWMSSAGITTRTTMTAFMQALGFTLQADGWQKRMNASCCTQGIAPPE